MFRSHKMSLKHGAVNNVRLPSFNHSNGDCSVSSLINPCNGCVQGSHSTQSSSKKEIIGPTGTVRGYKNMIKERKEILRLSFVGESFEESEEGKIVVYTTSMGGIRSTVEECAYIRKLFDNLGLKVDERDIFMHKDYQCQLDTRLAIQNATVPHVFVNGVSLGGVRELEHLNETGKLKTLFEKFERRNSRVCPSCGGFRYINCTQCHGSKRSRKTRISREINVLRCTACNENGLQPCSECSK